MPTLLCPICGKPLSSDGKCFRCENRHSFDIAKEGYVNLAPVQDGIFFRLDITAALRRHWPMR